MVNLMASEEHEARSRVERVAKLSDDVVQELDDDARAAIKAVQQFLVTVEEALPQGEGMRTAEKEITESALKMAQQLIHAQSEFLQKVVDSAGKSLSSSEDAK
jgi:hypothetical protein